MNFRSTPSLGLALASICAAARAAAAEPSPPSIAAEADEQDERPWLFDARLAARLASGAEWDSNAERAVITDVAIYRSLLPTNIVADGAARLLVDTALDLAVTPKDRLRLGYVLGLKRFFSESTEDLMVHELSESSAHGLIGRLDLETFGTYRASRIRSGVRDYTLGNAGGGLALALSRSVTARLRGSWISFEFPSFDPLSYTGPSAGGEIVFEPFERMVLSLHVDHAWRAYTGNAFQELSVTDPVTMQPVHTTCDGTDGIPLATVAMYGCTPIPRRDTEVSAGIRAVYRRSFVIGGEVLVRLNHPSRRRPSSGSPIRGVRKRVSDGQCPVFPADFLRWPELPARYTGMRHPPT
jgi:hypothetical protein